MERNFAPRSHIGLKLYGLTLSWKSSRIRLTQAEALQLSQALEQTEHPCWVGTLLVRPTQRSFIFESADHGFGPVQVSYNRIPELVFRLAQAALQLKLVREWVPPSLRKDGAA
jgi:hypothetical protein